MGIQSEIFLVCDECGGKTGNGAAADFIDVVIRAVRRERGEVEDQVIIDPKRTWSLQLCGLDCLRSYTQGMAWAKDKKGKERRARCRS